MSAPSKKVLIFAYERYRRRRTDSAARLLILTAEQIELATLPPGRDPVEIEVALMFERSEVEAPA